MPAPVSTTQPPPLFTAQPPPSAATPPAPPPPAPPPPAPLPPRASPRRPSPGAQTLPVAAPSKATPCPLPEAPPLQTQTISYSPDEARKDLIAEATSAILNEDPEWFQSVAQELRSSGRPLRKPELAGLVDVAAIDALSPIMLKEVLRLVNRAQHGDWTLLRWDGGQRGETVVYNSLLHDVVLATYRNATNPKAFFGEDYGDDEDEEDEEDGSQGGWDWGLYDCGLEVIRMIRDQRPSAAVDLMDRTVPLTPVEMLLQDGEDALDAMMTGLLQETAPLAWLRTAPGWAAQERAFALCDFLATRPAAAARFGHDAAGWAERGELLREQQQDYLANEMNQVLRDTPERMPPPASGHILLPFAALPTKPADEDDEDGDSAPPRPRQSPPAPVQPAGTVGKVQAAPAQPQVGQKQQGKAAVVAAGLSAKAPVPPAPAARQPEPAPPRASSGAAPGPSQAPAFVNAAAAPAATGMKIFKGIFAPPSAAAPAAAASQQRPSGSQPQQAAAAGVFSAAPAVRRALMRLREAKTAAEVRQLVSELVNLRARVAWTPPGPLMEQLGKEWRQGGAKQKGPDEMAALAAAVSEAARLWGSAEAALLAEVLVVLRLAAWRAATEACDLGMLADLASVKLPGWMRWSWEGLCSPDPPHTPLLQRLLERADEAAAEVARSALGRNQAIVRAMAGSPLLMAVRRGAPAQLVATLAAAVGSQRREQGGTLEQEEGATALGWALKERRLALLPKLLAQTKPWAPAADGLPPLHYAAATGDTQALTSMLDPGGRWWMAHGLQPEELLGVPPEGGVTALYRAVGGRHPDAVRVLVAAGADPLALCADESQKGFKDTPVHLAVALDEPELLRAMLLPCGKQQQHKQQRKVGAGSGADGAAAAAAAQQAQVLNRLVDGDRLTALMLAQQEGRAACLGVLMHAGADPTVLRDTSSAGGGGSKAGKKAQKGGGRVLQNVHLRSLTRATPEANAGSKATGSAESALSAALGAAEENVDALKTMLQHWRPAFSGTALRPDLGPAACARIREWLLTHADVTLWPAVQELANMAAASPQRAASPPWLSAPLIDLLLHLCREAGAPDWRASSGAANGALGAAAAWRGSKGTQPLPRLAVWGLVSCAVVGNAPPPGDVPAHLTPALLRELLQRGVVDPNERAPPGGTGQQQLLEGSSLLHKVCFTGDAAMLDELLAAGADIRATDTGGNTPLHVVASRPHREDVTEALGRRLLGRTGPPGTAQKQAKAQPQPQSHPQAQQLTAGGKDGNCGGGAGGDDGAAAVVAAVKAVVEEEQRFATLRHVNRNGHWPMDAAANKKTRRLLQQLADEVNGALQRAKNALQRLQQRTEQQEPSGADGAAGGNAAGKAPEVDSAVAAAAGDATAKADAAARTKGATAAADGAAAPARRLRTPADVADEEAVLGLGLAQLVAVPEPVVLPLAAKLAKLLPASCLRAPHAGGVDGSAAADGAAADGAAAADSAPANAATNRELQRIVGEMRVDDGEEEHLADPAVADADADAAAYSDDDAPPPGEALVEDEELLRQSQAQTTHGSPASPAAAAPSSVWAGAAAAADQAPDHPLRGLAWRFVITRQAYEAWGRLPDTWRRLVMDRLRVIGSGYWSRCRGAKKLTADDPTYGQQELWRLKITKAGRILFEVAVEYDEESRTWAEMIRLWYITLNHKSYEDMIGLVRQSFRRTLAMRERLRLQPLPQCEGPTGLTPTAAGKGGGGVAGAAGAAGRATQRLPRHYREAGVTAVEEAAGKTRGSQKAQAAKEAQDPAAAKDLREHFPPASWAADTYTLMKFYSLDATLVSAVLQGLEAAKVDFPFKLSPQEYDLITLTPSPPSSIILLGRSGTGKTTCAVYRLWGNWLRHHTNPGLDPVHAVFVTASATLRERVARAFRRLQSAVLNPEDYTRVVALSNATYHTFREVPSDAFPLFLSSRAFLRMLDGTTSRPFFPRLPNGAILQLPDDGEELDPDGAALVVALDEDASDEEEEDAEVEAADGAAAADGGVALEEEVAAAAATEAAEAARAAALQELEGGGPGGRGDGDGEAYGLGVAGRARLNREVTYQYFLSSMWKKITTAEQRHSVAPGLVYQEIMSYLKGSAEAISSPVGHLSLEEYLRVGRKRAANFSEELRRDLVWPIFERYERLKKQESRYDLLDVVGHVYREMTIGGYSGTPMHTLYRDEVQDFTQAELLLDIAVAADPNCLFYCGDTAQTIARGIGFRFEDIRTLFWEENNRRQQAAAADAAAAAIACEGGKAVVRRGRGATVATPPIYQLTMNYRTHQGVLDVAALVVDVLRRYFPRQLDRLDRERALFPGPHPLLLGGISADDLAILLSGSDRNTSQVEFGAHQVILVRSMAAVAELPQDIQDSNAIIMTVPQAKGLEFDDVFIVDFFADSEAGAEWRVLCSYLAELAGTGGVAPGDGHVYDMQQVTPPDPGAVRPLAFDERSHVLLSEELKHLYTALTRAKNNVVIFDRNPAKRAPFYHLLQSLGIARTVHKSLLEDGRDAVRYGLTQQATSSRAEWAKRARNLMDNRNYAMAKKAFAQAADQVRAEVADAYLKRHRAGEEDSLPERRRLLGCAALQLLAAVSRRADSPDPVTPAELRRWTSLAGKFLQACGQSAAAAELYFKAGNHRLALRMLLDGKEHRAAADCCLDAAAEALRQHDAALAAAAAEAADAAAAASAGGAGTLPLGPDGTGAGSSLAAADARKRALLWLVKGVEQVFLANDSELLLALLAPPSLPADLAAAAAEARRKGQRRSSAAGDGAADQDWSTDEEAEEPQQSGDTAAATVVAGGNAAASAEAGASPAAAAAARFAPLAPELHDELRRRWVGSYGAALQRVALRCHTLGLRRRFAAVVRLMPAEAERDALLAKLGYWKERARFKRSRDPLGAAQLLLDNGDTKRAARMVSQHIASKAATTPQPGAGLAAAAGAPGGGGPAWAAVDERAWELLHRCIAAQTDAAGARKLRQQLDRWAPSVAASSAPPAQASQAKPTAGEAAAPATASAVPASGAAAKMLLYRGHALLLEARLLLQSWAAAGTSAGSSSSGPAAGERKVPETWEDGVAPAKGNRSAAKRGSSSGGGAGEVPGGLPGAAWDEAAPLLTESVECFSRAGFWPGQLEALTLLLQFGPEDGSAAAAAILATEAQPTAPASQPPRSGASTGVPAGPSTAAAAAAAAAAASLRLADRATALLRTVQAATDAFGAVGTPRLYDLQRQHLQSLEQHFGLPGLSRTEAFLGVKQATHVWWAALGPAKAAEARKVLAGPEAPGRAAAAADAKAGKPTAVSYAAAAAKAALQPPPSQQPATAASSDVLPLAPSQAVLRQQLALCCKQAAVPDAAGLLPRSKAVPQLVRDVAIKVACLAHATLRNALDAYVAAGPAQHAAGATGPDGAAPVTSELLLTSLRPVVRAARVASSAATLLRVVEQKYDLQAAALQRCIAALLRRAFAIVATSPLAPAQSGSLQQDLQQPSAFAKSGGRQPAHGSLLELLSAESLPKQDLHDWVVKQVIEAAHLEKRLALAPAASYTAIRTLLQVLKHDEKAKKVFCARSGRLAAGVPAWSMLRVGQQTALPEYLLEQGFHLFAMGMPHRALKELLFYLAWCARRDGLLEAAASSAAAAATQHQRADGTAAAAVVPAARKDPGDGAALAASSATAGGAPIPAWVLPLEAYLELAEVVVGQLVTATCENAFLAANVAGAMKGMPAVCDPRRGGLGSVAATWNKLLGFDPPERPPPPGPGRLLGRGVAPQANPVFARMTAEYYKEAAEVRSGLGQQLLLGARLVGVLAAHLTRLATAEAIQRKEKPKDKAGGGESAGAAGAGARNKSSDGEAGASAAEGCKTGAAATHFLTEELLPLLEPPSRAAGMELLTSGQKGAGAKGAVGGSPPSAQGPRLVAFARRLLLAAASAWLSLEIQERLSAQQKSGGGPAAAGRGGTAATEQKVQPRGGWPTEAVRLFREACGALAEAVAPDFFQPPQQQAQQAKQQSKASEKGPAEEDLELWDEPEQGKAQDSKPAAKDFTLAALANQIRQLSTVACAPDGSMRQLVSKADRDFAGFGEQAAARQLKGAQAALFAAAQVKPQLPATAHHHAAKSGWQGLMAAAAKAVEVVAANDYSPTRDEQIRRSEAATTIQRVWRAWRQRRAEEAAAAQQQQREREALQRLREQGGVALRIAVRMYKKRLARNLLARNQREQAAAAEQGQGQAGQWDEFGFAAVEQQLQHGDVVGFIDASTCPVCMDQDKQQQQQDKQQQQQQTEGQQQQPKPEEQAAAATASPEEPPQTPPQTPSKSLKLPGSAFKDFQPHKHTKGHTEAVQHFRHCHKWFKENALPVLHWARGLLVELQNQRAGPVTPNDHHTERLLEAEMRLEGRLGPLVQLLGALAAQRNWCTLPVVVGEPLGHLNRCVYACQHATECLAEVAQARLAASAQPKAQAPVQPPIPHQLLHLLQQQQQLQQQWAPGLQQQPAQAPTGPVGQAGPAGMQVGQELAQGAALVTPGQQHAHPGQYHVFAQAQAYAQQYQQQMLAQQQALAQQQQQQQQPQLAMLMQQQLQQQFVAQQGVAYMPPGQAGFAPGSMLPAQGQVLHAQSAMGPLPGQTIWMPYAAPQQQAGVYAPSMAYAAPIPGGVQYAANDLPPGLNIGPGGGFGGPMGVATQAAAMPPVGSGGGAYGMVTGMGMAVGVGPMQHGPGMGGMPPHDAAAYGLRLDMESELATGMGGGGDGYQDGFGPMEGGAEYYQGDGLEDEEWVQDPRGRRRNRYKNGGKAGRGGGGGNRAGGGERGKAAGQGQGQGPNGGAPGGGGGGPGRQSVHPALTNNAFAALQHAGATPPRQGGRRGGGRR